MGATSSQPDKPQSPRQLEERGLIPTILPTTANTLADEAVIKQIQDKGESFAKIIELIQPQHSLDDIFDNINRYHKNRLDPATLENIRQLVEQTNGLFETGDNARQATTDLGLQQLLGKKVRRKFEAAKNAHMKEQYFQWFPRLRTSLESVLNTVSSLAARYRLYLYRYIQLNLFIPHYTMTMMELQNEYYTGMVALLVYWRETSNISIQAFVKTLEQALESGEDAALESLNEQVKRANVQLTKDMQATFEKVLSRARELEKAKTSDMVQWILNEQDVMQKEIAAWLEQKKATTSTPRNASNSRSAANP